MFKRFLFSVFFFLNTLLGYAQLNIDSIVNFSFPANRGGVTDLWGYVDEFGNEYAIVGMEEGVSIVDISTPNTPIEVFYTSGPTSGWRDIKVWEDVAYVTNESSGGLMIINMDVLPGGTLTQGDVSSFTGSVNSFSSAHNIYIDENGIGYIVGADKGGGANIIDIASNPLNPIELGAYHGYYFHDAMVRGDTLWGAAIRNGFFVAVDVSDKSNPVTLATHNTPGFFTHNCWISDDGQTLFTTDEKNDAYIGAFDVSNFSNITEIDRIQSNPGKGSAPHNVFYKNGYIITSYYTDGVTIHDVSDPSNMVEVGNYDTSPAFSGNGFFGCWGVYPYLPSGLIIASDRQNGLFVLGPTYVSGAYLEGSVIDSLTTANLDGVQVSLASNSALTNTNVLGNYKTGWVAGTFDITFTKNGYKRKIIQNVNLIAGNTTTLDAELVPSVTFTMQGKVLKSLTLAPIPNAIVKIENDLFTATVLTDALGNYTIPNVEEGTYEVFITKWGYSMLCANGAYFSPSSNQHDYIIDKGYYDDFTFDLGWTISGTASSGVWERAVPVGGNGDPYDDVTTDCNDMAYVTGNNGVGDDVGGGETILISPVFDLTTYANPYLEFSRWFFHNQNANVVTDSMVVRLSNGITDVLIDSATLHSEEMYSWEKKSIRILDYISLTNNMQFIIRYRPKKCV